MEIPDYALLLAIDSSEEKEVLRLASTVGSIVDGVKIGVPTMLSCGAQVVGRIKDRAGRPVVADLKVADIGFRKAKGRPSSAWSGTNSDIIKVAIGAGTDYVICQTIVGTSSIRECVETAHSMGGKVLTLPYMTHEGAGLFFDQPIDVRYTTSWLERESPRTMSALARLGKRKVREEGWRSRHLTISDLILAIGEECGVDGYVGPANMPDVMSDYRKVTERFVLAPGVGRQGGRLEDVYNILGPRSAAVVGHAIYAASDPLAASRRFLSEREKAIG